MATIDGAWDCEVDSPMGAQKLVLTIVGTPDGGFTGKASGPLGSLDVTDGRLSGEIATFRLTLTLPFPMALDCEAKLVSDDRIEGTVDTGAFGRYPIRATRQ